MTRAVTATSDTHRVTGVVHQSAWPTGPRPGPGGSANSGGTMTAATASSAPDEAAGGGGAAGERDRASFMGRSTRARPAHGTGRRQTPLRREVLEPTAGRAVRLAGPARTHRPLRMIKGRRQGQRT